MSSLSQKIKEEAIRLGFDKVGFARADTLVSEGNHLQEWLSRGFHGTMEWMARTKDKRRYPGLVFKDTHSVIALAMNYYVDVQHSDGMETGKISRYAWGEDYHEVMEHRLEKLLESIKRLEPGAEGKIYVDTGPVMEKVWAQRAGIGWEGKHTNVISPEFGSWIFLGEMLLNIELEYDPPATDHCGTCMLCIDACPTDAIVEPYLLDSTKCISYLTIEYHGPIPRGLGAKFDGWVYGCDICQDVCPWNSKFQTPTEKTAFLPRKENIMPDLKQLATITEDEFHNHYQHSPIKRTKRSGLRRNAMVNLINYEEGNEHGKK
jgi:epoxyqueuosine reductase